MYQIIFTNPGHKASMLKANMIGLDLAKLAFQAHRADETGKVVFRKRLRRDKVMEFFARQSACLVAMEACGGAHYCARAISKLGHEVRLIPASYVKPFVKRQKNDMADAEEICEAAQRPTMCFVAVKGEEQQASAVVFRARDLIVRQRTQTINALRGHLAEYGLVVAHGPSHVTKLIAQVEDPASRLPSVMGLTLTVLVDTLRSMNERIKRMDLDIARHAKEDEVARRFATIPGVGPITATALAVLAPPAETFKKGRDFAAWLGLTPLQRSTGGNQKLGKTSKMDERTLRRLLIIGACAVVQYATRRGVPDGSWLAKMLARKPCILVIVALANKMAQTVWALLAKGGIYQVPIVAPA